MKKVNIFLASSEELKPEREKFEIELRRKFKSWYEKGFYLDLDIWEDLTTRMSAKGSQEEYNNFVRSSDLFVLLAYTKMGVFTAEEFEKAFGQFKETQKPFIFTYLKDAPEKVDKSLEEFKQRLMELGHYFSSFVDGNDLWNKFNKELEQLEKEEFTKFERGGSAKIARVTGDKNVVVQADKKAKVKVKTGKKSVQKAEKIYNIKHIDKADFS